jgi:zinc transport system substrate-binding protein
MRRTLLMILLLISALVVVGLTGCTRSEQKASTKLQVVTTLFPMYDFARIIGGDRAEVSMLLPPGMEPHSFEPKPNDIIRIGKAGLFIYTNRYMEPWAGTILKGIERQKLHVVDAGQGVSYQKASSEEGDGHAHGNHGADRHAAVMDPHIWLDFSNAALMVDSILTGFIAADPTNQDYYRTRAAELQGRLKALDQRFRQGLSTCDTRMILHGGHFTFGYLARRYGLEYRSLSGISSESDGCYGSPDKVVRGAPSLRRRAVVTPSVRDIGCRGRCYSPEASRGTQPGQG